ncbi:MAG: DinB family protein [bacterium]
MLDETATDASRFSDCGETIGQVTIAGPFGHARPMIHTLDPVRNNRQYRAPSAKRVMSRRANALAERLEQGANALAAFASVLTREEWQTRTPKDGRMVGVIVHHVANRYPIEIELAQTLAAGNPIADVTWNDVNAINSRHAKEFGAVTKEEALALLKRNSAIAAAAVRALTDDELDRAATVSLNANAPLTCQFFIEAHVLSHSFHHLARLRAALAR